MYEIYAIDIYRTPRNVERFGEEVKREIELLGMLAWHWWEEKGEHKEKKERFK